MPTFPAGMWISLLITIFTINGIQATATPEFGVMHQFTAYDCERPLSMEALQLPSHCLDHKTDDNTDKLQTNLTLTDNKPYRLLQKATYHEFDAYVCTQSHSRFFYSCMWVSHSIVNRAPQTSHQIDTPVKFCAQAIRTRQFPTKSSKMVTLPGDGQTAYIPETVRGELIIGDNGFASCNGEDVRYHGRILKQTVCVTRNPFHHQQG